jgi:hypothetical protein
MSSSPLPKLLQMEARGTVEDEPDEPDFRHHSTLLPSTIQPYHRELTCLAIVGKCPPLRAGFPTKAESCFDYQSCPPGVTTDRPSRV